MNESKIRTQNFHAGFSVLIPDYYRGETAEMYKMTGTMPKFHKKHTIWENLVSRMRIGVWNRIGRGE